MTASKPHIVVACGVLRDAQGQVLIVERPAGKIAALKWEFPGGKVEAGEAPRQTLDRELHEEIGIRVREARPLILFTHEYRERTVTLHTFLVTGWDGEARGCESQRLHWQRADAPLTLDVLPTVAPILRALRLPEDYVFTPPQAPLSTWIGALDALPRHALLRLRRPSLQDADYATEARALIARARGLGLRVLLDRGEAMARALRADGLHFTQAALMESDAPFTADGLLRAASAHDAAALARATQRGMDALVIGSVRATTTHPGGAVLGWDGFAALARQANLPAYAIGGLAPADKPAAFAAYAQGVAGISAYWSRSRD